MGSASSGDSPPYITVLEQSPIIIEKILLDAPKDSLQWKPAMDRWSISEVLAHLTDVEICLRERVRKMVAEDSPTLELYDQNAAYAAGKYSGGLAREHLHQYCHERDRTLSMLRYLPPAAMAKTGQHSELGRITVADQLNEWAFHDLGHVRQISELYRARVFYPKLGSFKQYCTVKP
jgi:DinB family protein